MELLLFIQKLVLNPTDIEINNVFSSIQFYLTDESIMKKTIYLITVLFTVFFSTSCKKDYTCACTYPNFQYEFVIKDASKFTAKSYCLDAEDNDNGRRYCEIK